MSSGIVRKIVLIAVGVLLLVQLLFYGVVRVGNIKRSENERVRLAQKVEELSVTQSELQQYLGKLEQEYNEMVASVPPRILEGYEDPEVLLAGFLDYLKASELERVEARVTMHGARKYVEEPVPLVEQDLSIAFSFIDLSDAGDMLAHIFDQEHYPLAVQSFELRSSGQKKISGNVKITLLIPARQKQTLSAIMQGAR
jgi:hypothetical protein